MVAELGPWKNHKETKQGNMNMGPHVRDEIVCPTCHQRGLGSLQEAIQHCQQPAEEEGSEENVSDASRSTKQEIIDEIKKRKEKENIS